MTALFADLGVTSPVIAAPMAGGPTTPALVAAAGRVGALGFLAAGYRTPDDLAAQIDAVRAGGTEAFGVNVFVPNPVPVDAAEFRRYAEELRAEGERFGLDLAAAEPVEHDDHWAEKVDLLLARPVPVVSFTFGLPPEGVVAALRRAGTVVLQTVTSTQEARAAADAGVDGLVVQASAAGAHSGTFTPEVMPRDVPLPDLLRAVRATVNLPLVAAGGIATAASVADALRAGAAVAMVGTALLRTDESGASAVHKAALAERAGSDTVVTRAFSGRPARALRNLFVQRYHERAPLGYPAVHHLTTPLRRAAAAAGDAERVNLWAGTGFRHATDGPATAVLTALAADS
ncbi:nitronate monooxygenase [Dactylosporangium sp. NPDC051484]|uniref:NAD(P)H-dependent flavin oxidoreductase n=1 Tax=Dactylosporangium sp. NPDC051484 TaxID=3154942 RepID=UPI00344C5E9E